MAIERIDIKRVDEELESAIEKILKNNPNIKMTTKAVRFACIEYLNQCEEIERLKLDFSKKEEDLNSKISTLEDKVNRYGESNKKYKLYFSLKKEFLGNS